MALKVELKPIVAADSDAANVILSYAADSDIDLIVMGGSCQRTWEHAIPKTARSVGPRISVQFRPRGVR